MFILFTLALPTPAHANPFISRVHLPLLIGRTSKIGAAPGGYLAGDLARVGAAWAYTWDNLNPLTDTQQIDMISDAAHLTVTLRSNIVLGFNEPDLNGMSPLQGALLWRQIEIMHPDKQLISPAPSQHDPGWLWRMVAAYQLLYGTRPRLDGIAVHYYRWSDAMLSVSDYVMKIRADELAHGYNVPIWLTEVGIACGVDGIATLQDAVHLTQRTTWIAGMAWYDLRVDKYDTNPCSTLLDSHGLTALGTEYRRLATGDDNGF